MRSGEADDTHRAGQQRFSRDRVEQREAVRSPKYCSMQNMLHLWTGNEQLSVRRQSRYGTSSVVFVEASNFYGGRRYSRTHLPRDNHGDVKISGSQANIFLV
jgi:hypothetical protein